jgi:hypothetical protein
LKKDFSQPKGILAMRNFSLPGLITIAIFFTLFSFPAIARTNDAETPANEGVCDELLDDEITKGLYGLCVAFCEAQDCELNAVGEVPRSCQASNNRILENYDRKKLSSDPDMPCVKTQSVCPCWDDKDLDNANLVGPGSYCSEDIEPFTSHDIATYLGSGGILILSADAFGEIGNNTRCGNMNSVSKISVLLDTSAEQNQACRDDIHALHLLDFVPIGERCVIKN